MSRQIKLGAVTMGAGGPGAHFQWLDPAIPGDASVNIGWYIEVARLAEAARFDLIFIVDSQFITADSPPHYLNRLEPMTLLSALAVSRPTRSPATGRPARSWTRAGSTRCTTRASTSRWPGR
ncbi:MAG: hypothetical protein ACRDPO_15325 [Streptosporangiaceae bacterium]